jgi:hypothetical protein
MGAPTEPQFSPKPVVAPLLGLASWVGRLVIERGSGEPAAAAGTCPCAPVDGEGRPQPCRVGERTTVARDAVRGKRSTRAGGGR